MEFSPHSSALALDTPELLAELARVVALVGKPGFYDALSLLLARVLRCKRRLVMRYSAYDKPAFLINAALTEEGVSFYLAGLYRIDPLHRLARETPGPTVVNLRALMGEIEEAYFAELFKMAIFDELAIMVPAYGGVTIAFCCDRHRMRFEQQDYERAQALLPMVDALHKLHMDRLFSNAGDGGSEAITSSFRNQFLVLDRRAKVVYRTQAWSGNSVAAAALPQISQKIAEGGSGSLLLEGQQVVHWETLPDDFSLAPQGTLVVLEQRSPGPLMTSGEAALEAFCGDHSLTPREAEIVRLSFLGLPNAAIAKQLGVSVGTVKNHRWRLYYKLDITTERELFHLFISTLLSVEKSKVMEQEAPQG